jgi:hypothetical protein
MSVSSPMPGPMPGKVPGPKRDPLKDATRWRLRATISVHPSTLVALDELCEKFRTNRGRLMDKLVESVSAAYKDGRYRCITGGICTINRTDLPDVL